MLKSKKVGIRPPVTGNSSVVVGTGVETGVEMEVGAGETVGVEVEMGVGVVVETLVGVGVEVVGGVGVGVGVGSSAAAATIMAAGVVLTIKLEPISSSLTAE